MTSLPMSCKYFAHKQKNKLLNRPQTKQPHRTLLCTDGNRKFTSMLHNRTLTSLMKCANLCAGKQLHCQFLIRLPPSHLLKEHQNDLFFFFFSFLSYLVMPYMFTDLSKVRGHLSEDKVQFLVYQMLCGLRVSFGPFYSHTHLCVCPSHECGL